MLFGLVLFGCTVQLGKVVEGAAPGASTTSNAFLIDPGFDILTVAALAKTLPSHSWEFGTASEALLELYNPFQSVFGPAPFPVPVLDKDNTPSLEYAASKIVLGTGANILSNGDGAVGDPASLGVSAVLLGKTNETMEEAAEREVEYLLHGAPRYYNGAISQRVDQPNLWADFMYMAPPFLAYYAVDTSNASLLQEAVTQCGLYRQILKLNISTDVPYHGVWQHITGPYMFDPGTWSTGNAWAAAGMTRVLATVLKAPAVLTSGWGSEAVESLTGWIKEILDGAAIRGASITMTGGLLRNYLNDTTGDGHGYGETSGSSLLASVAYRMVVLKPEVFSVDGTYVEWADGIRRTLGSVNREGIPHVAENGIVAPAVNPLNWDDTIPYTAGSPEGQNFVVLMYAAWRDCVFKGLCPL